MNRRGRFAIYVFLTAVLEVLSLFGLSLFHVISIVFPWRNAPHLSNPMPLFMGLGLEVAFVFLILTAVGEILNWHLERRYKAGLQAANAT